MNRRIVTLSCSIALVCAAGCDRSAGPDEPTATTSSPESTEQEPPAQPADDESGESDDLEPALASVTRVERQVKHWADAPESIDVDDGVVLQYVNFPGHYEVFDEAVVKDCILAAEGKPFEIELSRYRYVEEDEFVRVTGMDVCPELTERDLAAQWLEAEALREAIENPDRSETDAAGWRGRGFYKTEDIEPSATPYDDGWKTFCGEKSGTPCQEAFGADG